jgi:hypothetical protein
VELTSKQKESPGGLVGGSGGEVETGAEEGRDLLSGERGVLSTSEAFDFTTEISTTFTSEVESLDSEDMTNVVQKSLHPQSKAIRRDGKLRKS